MAWKHLNSLRIKENIRTILKIVKKSANARIFLKGKSNKHIKKEELSKLYIFLWEICDWVVDRRVVKAAIYSFMCEELNNLFSCQCYEFK